jgi:hypothetical protein
MRWIERLVELRPELPPVIGELAQIFASEIKSARKSVTSFSTNGRNLHQALVLDLIFHFPHE